MIKLIRRFQENTNGAITVDFVILTASIVGLAVSFFFAMDSSTRVLSENTATKIVERVTD